MSASEDGPGGVASGSVGGVCHETANGNRSEELGDVENESEAGEPADVESESVGGEPADVESESMGGEPADAVSEIESACAARRRVVCANAGGARCVGEDHRHARAEGSPSRGRHLH